MIEQTVDEVAISMQADPSGWAELYMEQNATIAELENLIEQYRARIEMLLRDPEEHNH